MLSGLATVTHRLLPYHRLWENLAYEQACSSAPGTFVDLEVGRTHYRERGEGEPVVLLHGFLYHSIMWDPIVPALAERYRTLAIDLLGWGWSARDDRRHYDYALYARQLLEFLDAMQIDQARLIGQSMGGGTLIRLASEHPDRVRCLVLVDPASLPNPLALAGRLFALPGVGELLIALGREAVVAKNLRDLWFYDPSSVTRDHVAAVAEPLRIRGSTWTLLDILRNLDFGCQSRQVEALAQTDVEVLLVWGRQDRAVPLSVGEQMHRMLPGSELVVIDQAGHTPHEEQPERFLEATLPFLARC